MKKILALVLLSLIMTSSSFAVQTNIYSATNNNLLYSYESGSFFGGIKSNILCGFKSLFGGSKCKVVYTDAPVTDATLPVQKATGGNVQNNFVQNGSQAAQQQAAANALKSVEAQNGNGATGNAIPPSSASPVTQVIERAVPGPRGEAGARGAQGERGADGVSGSGSAASYIPGAQYNGFGGGGGGGTGATGAAGVGISAITATTGGYIYTFTSGATTFVAGAAGVNASTTIVGGDGITVNILGATNTISLSGLATFTQATSTSFFANFFNALFANISSLIFGNATGTNATITNAFAVTGTTTLATTSINNLGVSGAVAIAGTTTLATTTVGGKFTVNAPVFLNDDVYFNYGLRDSTNATGTVGQYLSSTGTSTKWVTISGALANGVATGSALIWNGSAWTENTSFKTDISTTTAAKFAFFGNGSSSTSTALQIFNLVGSSTFRVNDLGNFVSGNASTTGTSTIWSNLSITNILNAITAVFSNLFTTNLVATNATTSSLTTTGTTTLATTTIVGNLFANGTNTLATSTFIGDVLFNFGIRDAQGATGTPGQILSSVGTSTKWVSLSTVLAGTATGSTQYWNGSSWVENIYFSVDLATTTSSRYSLTGVGTSSTSTVLQTRNSVGSSTFRVNDNGNFVSGNSSTTGTSTIWSNLSITNILSAITAIFTNLFVTNATITNATTTNLFVVTGTSTLATTTINNLNIPTGILVVGGTTTLSTTTINGIFNLNGDVYANYGVRDATGATGTLGQYLSTTGTSTRWVSITGSVASGLATGSALYWNGSAWVENTAFNSDLSTTTAARFGFIGVGTSSTSTVLQTRNSVGSSTFRVNDLGNFVSGNASTTGTSTIWSNLSISSILNAITAVFSNLFTTNLVATNATTSSLTTIGTTTLATTTILGNLFANGTNTLATSTFIGDVFFNFGIRDSQGATGTLGQILSSNGTSTRWTSLAGALAGTATGSTQYWNGASWTEDVNFLVNLLSTSTGRYSFTGVGTSSTSTSLQVRSSIGSSTFAVNDNGNVTVGNASTTGTSTIWSNLSVSNIITSLIAIFTDLFTTNLTATNATIANATTTNVLNSIGGINARGNGTNPREVISASGTVSFVQFDITNNGASDYAYDYNLDGAADANDPAITLMRGGTYKFNLNAAGHPFYIKTANVAGTGSQYNSGVIGNGATSSIITFTVPMNAPSTLYYNCSAHAAMAGVIRVVDPSVLTDANGVERASASTTGFIVNNDAFVYGTTTLATTTITSASITAATSTNFFANIFAALFANISSLIFGNATGTNATITNAFVVTGTTTLATTTILGQLSVASITTQSASNPYYTLVVDANGVVRRAPVVNALSDVLENTLVTPPATSTLSIDDAYLLASSTASTTGAWLGQENKIATWNGAGWTFYTALANDRTSVQIGVNAGNVYIFDGINWNLPPVSPTTSWTLGGNNGTTTNRFGTLNGADVPIIASGTERMRFTAGGNIGVGTSTPNAQFDIFGNAISGTTFNVNANATNSNNVAVRIANAGSGDALRVSGSTTLATTSASSLLAQLLTAASSIFTNSFARLFSADFATSTIMAHNVDFGSTSRVRVNATSTAFLGITGIANGTDGRELTLVNASSTQSFTLFNQNASSTAANRIITGTGLDLSLAGDASVNLAYDAVASRWRVIGGSGAGVAVASNTSPYSINASGTVSLTATNTVLTIASTTVATTTNALYNQGGNLYWNGTILSGLAAASAQITLVYGENISSGDAVRVNAQGQAMKISVPIGGASTSIAQIGNAVTVDTATNTDSMTTFVGTDKIINVFADTAFTNYQVRLGIVSGTSTVWYAKVDTGVSRSTFPQLNDLKPFNSDKFVMVAMNASVGNDIRAGQIIGTSISMGAIGFNTQTQLAGSATYEVKVAQINADRVFYNLHNVGGNGQNYAGTLLVNANNTVSYDGGQINQGIVNATLSIGGWADVISVRPNTAVVMFPRNSDSYARYISYSISGNTVTQQSDNTMVARTNAKLRLVKMAEGVGAYVYSGGAGTFLRNFTVAANGVMTPNGTEVLIDAQASVPEVGAACAGDYNCAVLVKRSSGELVFTPFTASSSMAIVPTLFSSTSFGIFNSNTSYSNASLVSDRTGKYSLTYINPASTNDIINRIIQMGESVSIDRAAMIGIAQTTNVAGASGIISLFSGLSQVHNGFAAGSLLYLNNLGGITSSTTDFLLGRALSSSTMQLLANNFLAAGATVVSGGSGSGNATLIQDGVNNDTRIETNAGGFDDNFIRFYTTSVQRMVISALGSVGINTGAPSANSALQVNDGNAAVQVRTNGLLAIGTTTATALSLNTKLLIDGGIELNSTASSAPSITIGLATSSSAIGNVLNSLYNIAGELYFNGFKLLLANGNNATSTATSTPNSAAYQASYIFAKASTASSPASGSGHYQFDSIQSQYGNDVNLDLATTYTTTQNVASKGRFTIKAGKTYKLASSVSGGSSAFTGYGWYNADTNVLIGAPAMSHDYGTGNVGFGSSGPATAVITPNTDTRVEVRCITAGGGGCESNSTTYGQSWASIEVIAGQLAVTGSSVDFGNAVLASNQAVSAGNDVNFTYQAGNLPYASSSFTLFAGRTYNLESTLAQNGGVSNGDVTYQWRDNTNGALIGNTGGYLSPNVSTNEAYAGQASAIITPTTNINVSVRIISATTGNVKANSSYAKVTQLGANATTEYSVNSLGNFTSDTVIISGTLSEYINHVNVAQSTSGRSLTLPNPANVNLQRIVYINNTGTTPFNMYGTPIEMNASAAFIWNGARWNSFGNATVLSEFGEDTTITNGSTVPNTTFVDVPGSNFTIQSAGTWEITYTAAVSNGAVGGTSQTKLVNAANVDVPASYSSYQSSAAGERGVTNQTVRVVTTGPATYKMQFASGGANTTTIWNNTTNNGQSNITWKKIGGFTGVTGQLVDYLEARVSGTISGANVTAGLFTSSGNIPNTSNQVTLSAGKTYRIVANLSATNLGASVAVTPFIYNLNTGTTTASGALYSSTWASNNDTAADTISVVVTPSVSTTYELRASNVGGGAPLLAGTLSVTQIGNSATTESINSNLGNFATSSAILSTTIDQYQSTYQIAQTTVGATLSIPNPSNTALTRIVYIDNIGSASFRMHGINVAGGDSVAFKWNGTTWKQFGSQQGNGVVASYMQAFMNTTYSNLAATDHLRFDTVTTQSGSDITLDSATAYSTANNVPSIGRFTLKAGKTYKLSYRAGTINTTDTYMRYAWNNVDTGAQIGEAQTAWDGGAYPYASGGDLATIFTPTVDTRVAVRINSVGSGTNTWYGGNGVDSQSVIIEVIAGQSAVTGFTVDTLYVTRSGSNQTQGTNWTSKDIILNTVNSGNIPFNTTTGIATLSAGKTYSIRAGLSFNAGANYNIQYQLVDGSTNAVISPVVEMVQSTNGTNNIGGPQLEYTYTPTTNQTVKLRTTAATNMLSAESLRADIQSFMSITQLGSSATTEYVSNSLGDQVVDGNIFSATVSEYINHVNINQTTVGRSLNINSPTNTALQRIIYINNIGTASFTMHGALVGAGESMAFIWNGASWKGFGNQAGNVASEFGDKTVFANASFGNSPVSLMSFTLPSAGVWEVDYNISGTGNGLGNSSMWINDFTGSIVTGSAQGFFSSGATTETVPVSQTVRITTDGARTFTLVGQTGASTYSISNGNCSVASSAAACSKVSWKKISGFLTVSGQTSEFISGNVTNGTVASNNIFALTSKAQIGITVTGGNTILLKGGKTYRITSDISTNQAAQINVYWYNLTAGTVLDNYGGFYKTPSPNNSNYIDAGIDMIFTPPTDTQIQLRGSSNTNISYNSPFVITQLGSSVTTGNAFSSFVSAIASNVLDNFNFAQTWNWSTATSTNPLSLIANLLTTGSLLNLDASNASNTALALNIGGAYATKKGADYSVGGIINDANFGNTSLVRMTGTSTQTLTGISGGSDGERLTVVNATVTPLIIANSSASSTASNRILTGTAANLTVVADASVQLVYDSGASKWRVVGGSGSGSGSSNSSVSVADLAADGNIGASAAATVDIANNINLTQTTALRTLSLHPLTAGAAGAGKLVTVINTGSAVFTMYGSQIAVGGSGVFVWNGTGWSAVQANGSNVAAENGFVTTITDNQSFSSVTYTDVAGGAFTLPSAGTYSISYSMFGGGAGFTQQGFRVVTSANAVVPNSYASSQNDTSATRWQISQTVQITIGAATSYKIQIASLSGGITVVRNISGTGQDQNNSNITWNKISGNAPVTGQTVDYVSTKLFAPAAVTAGSVVPYTTVSGNIPNTGGVFTLTAGKTYRLQAATFVNSAILTSKWRDITNNVLFGNSADTTGTVDDMAIAEAIITPTTNITVRLENILPSTRTYQGAADGSLQSQSWATIVQLGSTAATGVAFNTLTAAIASGALDNTNFGQTWSWSTLTTGTGLNLNANTLTTGSLQSLTSSSTGLNSINGLLYVANTGNSNLGTLASFVASTTLNSGLYIKNNGIISIGTSTTEAWGSSRSVLKIGSGATLIAKNQPGTPADYNYLALGANYYWDGTSDRSISASSSSRFEMLDGAIRLQYASSSAAGGIINFQNALTMTSTGNIGIGTTTPTAQLHTTGSVRFSSFGAGTLQTLGDGTLTVSSDERLKNVEGDYKSGLDAINGLTPISYTWNASTSGYTDTGTYVGFSAQNVQANIPGAVATDTRGYLTLSDRPILATLVNAMKEMNARVFSSATTTSMRIDELTASTTIPVDVKLRALGTNAQQVNEFLASLASSTAATTTISTSTDIYGTLVSTTTDTFVGSFFKAMTKRLTEWFAEATNGIAKIFVGEVETKKLCVANDAGERTCLSKEQIDALLSSGANNNSNNNSNSGNSNSGSNSGSGSGSGSGSASSTGSGSGTGSSTDPVVDPIVTPAAPPTDPVVPPAEPLVP